jgi:hypothetical protein
MRSFSAKSHTANHHILTASELCETLDLSVP